MKAVFNRVSIMLALTSLFTTFAMAQLSSSSGSATAPQAQGGNMAGGQRRGGGMGNFGIMRFLRQLNLSDDQKKQVMAIATKYFESTKTQREELMKLQRDKKQGTAGADADDKLKALRKEMNKVNADMRKEIMPILTAEQRTQLEKMMKEEQEKQKAARASGAQ